MDRTAPTITTSTHRADHDRARPGDPAGPPVALMVPGLDLGGAERITLNLARAMAASGRVVDLVVGSADGPLAPEVPDDLPLVDLGARHLRTALPALTHYVRRRRPAALLPTIGHADLLAMLAVRLAGTDTRVIPRISNTLSHARTDGLSLRTRAVRRLTRRLYRDAELLVACSHGMAEDLVGHVGIDRTRIRVLPNATVDPDLRARAAETVQHPWWGDPRVPTLLTVGSLIPQKNQALLLQALARVRAVRPVRLVVLGEGPLRRDLQRQVDALGLTDAVDLAGTDTNPYRHMARCDVFVLSSDWEGLPGVLIEAIALGANTVATDCPSGPREILGGGRHGRLVPTGDAEAMARAILAALELPKRPDRAAWQPYTGEAAARAYDDLLVDLGVWPPLDRVRRP